MDKILQFFKLILPPRGITIIITWVTVASANSFFHETFPWFTAEQFKNAINFLFLIGYIFNAAYDRYETKNMITNLKNNNKGLGEERDKNKKKVKELQQTASDQALYLSIMMKNLTKDQLYEVHKTFKVEKEMQTIKGDQNVKHNESSKNN